MIRIVYDDKILMKDIKNKEQIFGNAALTIIGVYLFKEVMAIFCGHIRGHLWSDIVGSSPDVLLGRLFKNYGLVTCNTRCYGLDRRIVFITT